MNSPDISSIDDITYYQKSDKSIRFKISHVILTNEELLQTSRNFRKKIKEKYAIGS